MPAWKKTKKGETIEHEGATLHWCKHHIHTEGLLDGLYIVHKPKDHKSWKEAKNERYGKRKKPKIVSTYPPKLSLSDKTKAALGTKCKMEPNEIDPSKILFQHQYLFLLFLDYRIIYIY